MNRYALYGVDEEGHDSDLFVDAKSAMKAKAKAELKGMTVSKIEKVLFKRGGKLKKLWSKVCQKLFRYY